MSKLLKIPVLIITFSGFIFVALYLYGVYRNNQDIPEIDKAIISQHLKKSLLWLKNNEEKVLSENNVMLWWMLYEAEKTSHDPYLQSLLNQYFIRYTSIRRSVWGPLFDGPRAYRISAYSISNLPYYNKYFIYSLHCASALADEDPIIEQQNDAEFCHQAEYIYRPACITHQLMGINFLQQKKCSSVENIDSVKNALQQDVIQQLRWDIRVVDVYLQRVLMLLVTGDENEVKPAWIQQVLNHQLDDGGWGDFDPLFSISSGRSIGFSSRIISIGSEKSTLHATAQGVYLLTLLSGKH